MKFISPFKRLVTSALFACTILFCSLSACFSYSISVSSLAVIYLASEMSFSLSCSTHDLSNNCSAYPIPLSKQLYCFRSYFYQQDVQVLPLKIQSYLFILSNSPFIATILCLRSYFHQQDVQVLLL